MTEYFPEEKEDEDATFIVSSFKILHAEGGGGGRGLVKTYVVVSWNQLEARERRRRQA